MRDDQDQATDGEPDSNDLVAADVLRALIDQLAANPDSVFPPTSPDDATRVGIVERALSDPGQRLQLLRAAYPEAACSPSILLGRLAIIVRFLGCGQPADTIAGRVWLEVVKTTDAATSDAVLTAYAKIDGTGFWALIGPLQVVLSEYELSPGFALTFFTDLFKRSAKDIAGGLVCAAVQRFTERFPGVALQVLHRIQNGMHDDHCQLAPFMLGTLRQSSLTDLERQEFDRVADGFRDSPAHPMRSVYHRSWATTAWQHSLTVPEITDLLARANAAPPEETTDIMCVVCQVLMAQPTVGDARSTALNWLRARADSSIASQAKFMIAQLAAKASSPPGGNAPEEARVLEELVFATQPIPVTDGGTWTTIQTWLVNVLGSDGAAFDHLFVQFAERDPEGVDEVIRKHRHFDWLQNEMRIKRALNPVGRLIVSGDSRCRRLGLHLFDTLPVDDIPEAVLNDVEDRGIRLIFHEVQRAHLRGEATARMLVSLLPRVTSMDERFQDEFLTELVYQGRNYPGAFRDELTKRAGDAPMVKRALQDVESYFESLRAVQASDVAAMEVPGYHRACRLFGRGFSQDIADGMKRGSGLLSVLKPVRLLYGSTAGSYFDEQLTGPSPLQHFSYGTELPVSPFSDPEGRLLREHNINLQIRALTEIEPLGKTAEGQ